jgi:predicted transposase YbfD/YdcC
MKESKDQIKELIKVFGKVEEPRMERHRKYPLIEILFLTISAVMSNCDSWDDIEDFGYAKLAWLRKYLPFKEGIPSHDTINRTMSLIDFTVFQQCFMNWATMDLTLPTGTVINLDGKRLRGSASKSEQQLPRQDGGKIAKHLLHAWCDDVKLCISQYQVSEQSNEINAIPDLLELLMLKDCIVTIDAIGCQKNIVKAIQEKGADYLIAVKSNQAALRDTIQQHIVQMEQTAAPTLTVDAQTNFGHGRREERRCTVLAATHLPNELHAAWGGLTQVVRIQTTRETLATKKIETEERYYITSLSSSASKLNGYIRQHWSIENRLHWTLDVAFGEDHSLKRTRNAATNFSIILKICLNQFNKLPKTKTKMSFPRKRKKCALSDSFREECLNI